MAAFLRHVETSDNLLKTDFTPCHCITSSLKYVIEETWLVLEGRGKRVHENYNCGERMDDKFQLQCRENHSRSLDGGESNKEPTQPGGAAEALGTVSLGGPRRTCLLPLVEPMMIQLHHGV